MIGGGGGGGGGDAEVDLLAAIRLLAVREENPKVHG